MKTSDEKQYSIASWFRDLRKNGLAKHNREDRPKTPKWKFHLATGLWFLFFGALQIRVFGDSLLEWWRITNLSYAEVVETPFLPIWTSGRGVVGVIWLLTGIFWISASLRARSSTNNKTESKTKKQNPKDSIRVER